MDDKEKKWFLERHEQEISDCKQELADLKAEHESLKQLGRKIIKHVEEAQKTGVIKAIHVLDIEVFKEAIKEEE